MLCLADILTDDSHSEATRAEAAAVVAQVTSPHLPFTQHLSSFLESMEEIVTALVSESSGVRGGLVTVVFRKGSLGPLTVPHTTPPQRSHVPKSQRLRIRVRLERALLSSLLLQCLQPSEKLQALT